MLLLLGVIAATRTNVGKGIMAGAVARTGGGTAKQVLAKGGATGKGLRVGAAALGAGKLGVGFKILGTTVAESSENLFTASGCASSGHIFSMGGAPLKNAFKKPYEKHSACWRSSCKNF